MTFKYNPEIAFYHANKNGNGTALQFTLETGRTNRKGKPTVTLFMAGAPQTGTNENGNGTFGWREPDKRVDILLGMPDVAEMLLVLNGAKQAAGLVGKSGKASIFHKNAKGNSTISFEDGERGLAVRISSKQGDLLKAVAITLTQPEGLLLKHFLTKALDYLMRFAGYDEAAPEPVTANTESETGEAGGDVPF